MKRIEKKYYFNLPYGFSSSIAARMCKDFIYWVGASNNRSRFGKHAGFTILGIRSGKRKRTLLSKKNWDCAVVRMFSTESES